ncbi:DUF1972 domain-containing protein [Brevundimonas goettingensis]|uniref:DUF1972 domain-containing protein n=1 Tax=Brevundimonas goettingensis TaxID=2774190 RepID=UPI001CED7629|nr:DUF1972 domain-containing protein [Brevundimonas goettingensis]
MGRSLYILGTRGVPAAHGGFETFAQRFALHMRDNGWAVTVYCQADTGPAGPTIDEWEGIRRVTFVADAGAVGTMKFDWACTRHAMKERGVMLVLGYNTAAFSALLRFTGNPVLMNMDGIEWKRAKWPWHGRIWLYLNEWIGALTSVKLVADHPEIARHLKRRRRAADIVMIPYGADPILEAPEEPVRALGVEPGRYLISIGRIEPENNILTMVQAFAAKPRDIGFVCLGKLEPDKNPYHAAVIAAGAGRVLFPGAIYDQTVVQSLRFHAAAYCHGHSVGGTNPSLVEALGAGNAVVGHDNPYNRWVAGPGQFYFGDMGQCSAAFDRIEVGGEMLNQARESAKAQFLDNFQWPPILQKYAGLCSAPQGS